MDLEKQRKKRERMRGGKERLCVCLCARGSGPQQYVSHDLSVG